MHSSDQHNPRAAIQTGEDTVRLQAALERLNPKLREVVILHFLEGCGKSEVARIINQHPSTVRRLLDSALRELRLSLQDAPAQFGALSKRPSTVASVASLLTAIVGMSEATNSALAAETADTLQLLHKAGPVIKNAAAMPRSPFVSLLVSHKAAFGALLGCISAGVLISFSPALRGSIAHSGALAHDRALPAGMEAANTRNSAAIAPSRSTPSRVANRPKNVYHSDEPVNLASTITSGPATRSPFSNASLSFRLINSDSLPVKDAGASLKKYTYEMGQPGQSRSISSSSSLPPAVSDSDGSFTLNLTSIPSQVDRITLVVHVEHPDYATTGSEVELHSVRPIVLDAGNTLAVRPVLEDGTTCAQDYTRVCISDSAMITTSSWTARPDGTWLGTRLANGVHFVFVEHTPPGSDPAFSDITSVTLPRTSREPVKVELHPAFTLHGRIDAAVSRPIVAGKVQVSCNPDVQPLHPPDFEPREYNGALIPRISGLEYGWANADISPDGAFEIPRLPRADVRLVAFGDGWISESDDPTTSPYGWHARQISFPGSQIVDIPATRTGDVLVHVQTKAGAAISSATVHTRSSISWSPIETDSTWMGAKRQAVTDGNGDAVLRCLYPRQTNLNVRVPHYLQSFIMDSYGAYPQKNPALVQIKPGEMIRSTLVLEYSKDSEAGGVRYTYPPPAWAATSATKEVKAN